MDVGTHLRTARERRGLTLADIAERTRISPRVLRALEGDDVAALPPAIFVRGFIRSYAREVGADPQPLVDAYMTEVAPPVSTPVTGTARVGDEPLTGRGSVPRDDLSYLGEEHPRTSAAAALALAALALAVVSYLSLSTRSNPAEDAPVRTNPAEVAAARPSAGTAEGAPVGTSGRISTLEIHPSGPCWVEVRVDGESRVYRLMQEGDRETVTLTGDAVLRVGDPTVFAYSLDGRPGRPLGITSRPVTVRINRANLAEFSG